MARPLRVVCYGVYYHVVIRGNADEEIVNQCESGGKSPCLY